MTVIHTALGSIVPRRNSGGPCWDAYTRDSRSFGTYRSEDAARIALADAPLPRPTLNPADSANPFGRADAPAISDDREIVLSALLTARDLGALSENLYTAAYNAAWRLSGAAQEVR
jgi:hypothetical protein